MSDFSLAHHTNRSPKIKLMVTKSQQNTKLITFFDSSGVVHHEFVHVRREC